MNWIKQAQKMAPLAVCVTGLVLLCGCGTMLSNVGTIPDDQVAYVVKGALGQSEAQQEIAARIAAQELSERMGATPVTRDSRNLGLWQQRRHALEAPIAIDIARVERAPELRDISDRNRITAYIQTHPEMMQLAGAEYSEDWQEMQDEAREKVKTLSTDLAKFIKEADQAAAAKNLAQALAALAAALEITPDDQDLAGRGAQAALDGWKAAKDSLDSQILKKAPALLAQRDATTQQLDRFEKLVRDEQDALLTIMRVVTTARAAPPFLDSDRLKEAGPLLQKSSEVLNGIWEKYTELLAGRADYWALYQYLAARIEAAQTQSILKHGQLGAKATALFTRYLPAAMAHFVEAASAAYNRDQYGLSYICCLMVEEMHDYAANNKMAIPPEAAKQLGFVKSIEKDNVEKIAAQHNRRLIVLDFRPAVTEEGEQVAYQTRVLCSKKYAQANPLAWRLTVPQGKTLSENTIQPLDPMDTLISGEIKEVTINTLPVREYDQEFIEVGSENIVEVVNPMYAVRDKAPRTIWQQEVAKFYRIKREHRKEGILSLTLYGERPEQPPATLLDLHVQFPGKELPLDSLTMLSEEIAFANPIAGMPRTAMDKEDLEVDPYPQSVPAQLASDKEITKAVLEFALNKIDAAIEKLVAQYPITKLAEPATDAQKKGQHALCAEQWGQFILYCRELTKATLPEAERDAMPWTALRTQMEKNLAAWTTTRWKGLDASALEALAGLWTRATQETLQALAEKSGE